MPGKTSADPRDRFNLKRSALLKLEQSFYSIGDTKTADIIAVRLVNLHREGIATKASEVMKTLKPSSISDRDK